MRYASVLLVFGALTACTKTDPGPVPHMLRLAATGAGAIPLNCFNDACWTEYRDEVVGPFEKWRLSLRYQVPYGWKLIGPADVRFTGTNIYGVETTAWDTYLLTCSWHAEGGVQGSAVGGYCIVKAEQREVDPDTGKPR